MKKILFFSFLILCCIINSKIIAEESVIELEKCECTSDQIDRNTSILKNYLKPNTVIQLPAGSFKINSLSISDIENLKIIGTIDSNNYIQTYLSIEGTNKLTFSNVPNLQLENIQIQKGGIALNEGGYIYAKNFNITPNQTNEPIDCLKQNLDWLVPVISLILN